MVEERDDRCALIAEGFEIPVSADQFAGRVGESVTLGIRPQYLSPDGSEYQFTVIADVVEQLGTEFVVHGRTPNGEDVDVVSSTLGHLEHGDKLTVGFDVGDLYVFDDDGQTICYGDELANGSPKQPYNP
jgi:multiple sugar transport system ATP-binding protein